MHILQERRQNTNVSEPERWASLIGGSSLIAYGLARRDLRGFAMAALGGLSVYRGASGHCDIYQALGLNTAKPEEKEKGTGRNVSVPYELGIRVDKSIVIDKPVHEVYRFWRQLDNLPRFMNHLKEVRIIDDKRSHWVAKGPANLNVQWDAEIINEIENEVIGWRSLPGSMVDNAGSVQFSSVGNNSTEVMIELQYNPPAGALGNAIARMFGEDPRAQIDYDLQRLKELLETGSVSTQATVRGKPTKRTQDKTVWDRDRVSVSSEESFPASDPPSWTPESL